MRFGAKAPRPPQRLGHSATLHSHAIAPAQFVGPGNAAHFLIRADKPSHTTGTLCDIFLKFFVKILYKLLTIIFMYNNVNNKHIPKEESL
jgi:hypothetical protein